MLVGIIWIAATANLQSYSWLLLGLILFGIGIPLTIPNCYTTVITAVDSQYMGIASGTLSTVRETALSIGIALSSAIISSYNLSYLQHFLKASSQYANITPEQINLLLVGKNTVQNISSNILNVIKHSASAIYTDAFACAMIMMAILALIAFLTTIKFIKSK